MKDTVVLYHGSCPDGLGGAYSAWKKFGESADYIAVFHGEPKPEGLEGKVVYMIDFSYPKPELLLIEKIAKKLVVLDHHEGAKEAVEAVQDHIFDNDRSGTGIAWKYFFDKTPLPRILTYIQDNDLWRNSLPHAKEVAAYLGTMDLTFDALDAVVEKGSTEAGFEEIVTKGTSYREYFDYVCKNLIETAEEVMLGEYKVYAVNAPRLFRSEIGNKLAEKHPPFSIVWYPNHGMWHFSLRGKGEIDLFKVAQRYGGNGHKNAASFRLPLGAAFPFAPVAKE
jgi:oligoribonuclease NrnB/cAMP/cGMP phosphodiesterase (DHH superfamily)